jgi:hypothetical protein
MRITAFIGILVSFSTPVLAVDVCSIGKKILTEGKVYFSVACTNESDSKTIILSDEGGMTAWFKAHATAIKYLLEKGYDSKDGYFFK